jgi:hypothetical protein
MPTLPTAAWLAALADMDAAVAAARAALDDSAARWPDEPVHPITRIDDAALTGWTDRVAAAGRLAADLERDLAEQEAAVGRWRGAFTRWRADIQQPPDPLP